jgi:hypothetical protein
MEKWKTTTRFSTFPRGSRDDSYGLCFLEPNTKARRSAASRPLLFTSRDHVVLEMLIEIEKLLAATAIDAVQQAQSWRATVGRF